MAQRGQKQSKFFYGWVVVAGILLIQGAAVGILSNTLSTFYVPVSEMLGVSRATFTLYNTFGMVSGLLVAPLWGEFFRSRRFKPYMMAGSIIVTACMFGYSAATNVFHFYAIATVKGIFQGVLTGVPIAKILSNWFIEKRGTATGIALSGSGLAGMIMTPIISRTIEGMGWRAGYRQLGIVFFVITVPVLLFLIRETPEEMGLKPYGYNPAAAPKVTATGLQSGISRSQAFRSKTFWFYAFALLFSQVCGAGLQNNLISHLRDIGYEPLFAASIFSIMMGMLVPGKILVGWLYDTKGMKAGSIFVTFLLCLSGLALANAGTMPIPYLFALLFGFANTIQTMQLPYLTGRLFGNKEYTRIYGICQPFTQLGSAFITPVSNLMQQSFGSYVPVFYIFAGLSLVTMLLLIAAINASPKEIEKFDIEDGLIVSQSELQTAAN